MCHGVFTLFWVGHDSHLHPVARIASDVAGDGTLILFYNPPDQRVVFTFGCLVVKLKSQTGFRIGGVLPTPQAC